jgi:hypothetical protein
LRCFSSTLSSLPVAAALALSLTSWVLLRFLQVPSQSCDVWCFSMAPTIVTGSHACVYTCVTFRLWDFLMGELLCPPRPSAPAEPVISENTTAAEKEKLLDDYKNHLASHESLFHAYRTWLDEVARAGSVLTASMKDRFVADIVNFEWTHQMWSFLHQKYESTGQSTYLAAIHQEQLLR